MVPEGWRQVRLGELFDSSKKKGKAGLPTMSVTLNDGLVLRESLERKTDTNLEPEEHLLVKEGYIAYNMMRMWQGASGLASGDGLVSPAYVVLKPRPDIDPLFASYFFKSARTIYLFWAYSYGLTKDRLRLYFDDFSLIPTIVPSLEEQRRIGLILSTWDRGIETIEKLIAASERQRQALIRGFASGELRFAEYRKVDHPQVRLSECAECLDNRRVPLNSEQRGEMQGEIPYYGANGILDYVNDYIFDEHLVLLAEDGGYFDEYQHRPIAQLVLGKSWVNNHAHILRAAETVTTEWIYYSLVHKNILAFINSGTRSKLNKSDMLSIPIFLPSIEEQKKNCAFLGAIDAEIAVLYADKERLVNEKSALMQQVLTGKRRVKIGKEQAA